MLDKPVLELVVGLGSSGAGYSPAITSGVDEAERAIVEYLWGSPDRQIQARHAFADCWRAAGWMGG